MSDKKTDKANGKLNGKPKDDAKKEAVLRIAALDDDNSTGQCIEALNRALSENGDTLVCLTDEPNNENR